MQKYLWIGGYLDDYLKKDIIENNGKIMSSYISQKNIFDGIEKNSTIVFDSINSLRLEHYPKYKKLFIKKHVWSHQKSAIDVYVGYLNLKYLAIKLKTITLKRECRKWANKNKNKKVTVFVFGMHSPYMVSAKIIKKIIPNTKLVLINPDLPQFMDGNQSVIKKILKRIDGYTINKTFKLFDKHILYSKYMADALKIDKKNWIVMEGSINLEKKFNYIKKQDNNKFIVMYSGVIGKMYGTVNLIKSILELGDEYELWLFGTGDLDEYTKKIAQTHNNIKFFGYCNDSNILYQYQRNSSVLITLIDPYSPVSNYCFPSKIFEYLMSGNPVISTKINGIPNEYFEYLIPIENNESETISKAIKEVKNMTQEERDKIGKKGKEFISKNKNIDVQAKKIIDFINS